MEPMHASIKNKLDRQWDRAIIDDRYPVSITMDILAKK